MGKVLNKEGARINRLNKAAKVNEIIFTKDGIFELRDSAETPDELVTGNKLELLRAGRRSFIGRKKKKKRLGREKVRHCKKEGKTLKLYTT